MVRRIVALALACLPLAAAAQFWNPSAVNSAGVSKKTITAPRFDANGGDFFSAATGANTANVQITAGGGASEGLISVGPTTSDVGLTGANGAVNGVAGLHANGTPQSELYMSLSSGELAQLLITAGSIVWNTSGTTMRFDQGLSIGTTSPAPAKISGSFRTASTIDLASIAANVCATDSTITVTGAVAGAECIVGSPAALTAGLIQTCFVSAADTVKLRTCNSTAGAIDQASATYSVRVFNP